MNGVDFLIAHPHGNPEGIRPFLFLPPAPGEPDESVGLKIYRRVGKDLYFTTEEKAPWMKDPGIP
jgi:hypothetical protein